MITPKMIYLKKVLRSTRDHVNVDLKATCNNPKIKQRRDNTFEHLHNLAKYGRWEMWG